MCVRSCWGERGERLRCWAGLSGGVEGDAREKRVGRWIGCEMGVGTGASWAAGGERATRSRAE